MSNADLRLPCHVNRDSELNPGVGDKMLKRRSLGSLETKDDRLRRLGMMNGMNAIRTHISVQQCIDEIGKRAGVEGRDRSRSFGTDFVLEHIVIRVVEGVADDARRYHSDTPHRNRVTERTYSSEHSLYRMHPRAQRSTLSS